MSEFFDGSESGKRLFEATAQTLHASFDLGFARQEHQDIAGICARGNSLTVWLCVYNDGLA